MIERFYLKEFLTFKELELEFKPGLNVFTGPSGSGKSILMRAILSTFGMDNVDALMCESSINWSIDEEMYGIENESPNVFRQVKKEKTRYFINNQSVSKSSMEAIGSSFVRHLSLKDYSDFEPERILETIDRRIALSSQIHSKELLQYTRLYKEFRVLKTELSTIEEKERHLEELKEFARFEMAKIDAIKPRIGEDEELLIIKKQLSKKEKIEHAIAQAESIFTYETQVHQTLSLLEFDSLFFDDAMNQLRHLFESSSERMNELEEIDVESVLNRIEQLSELKRRYGSIEEALAYREKKALELEEYDKIEHSKQDLQARVDKLFDTLKTLADRLSERRFGAIDEIRDSLNRYLTQLYLRGGVFEFEKGELSVNGYEIPVLGLAGTKLSQLSSGEFNRLRLALLALGVESMEAEGGVLMLDEIDANLSGEESMSVAKVLRHLSKKYQIFVISHQPQLTSMGEHHFKVFKEAQSEARKLDDEGRIEEIARIISGDQITDEARGFARDLFERSKGFV